MKNYACATIQHENVINILIAILLYYDILVVEREFVIHESLASSSAGTHKHTHPKIESDHCKIRTLCRCILSSIQVHHTMVHCKSAAMTTTSTTRTLFLLASVCLLSATCQDYSAVVSLRGSGSAAPCLELIMDLIHDRAQLPTRLTYRQIDNITSAQDEFVESVVATGGVDFGSGHVPLSTQHYSTLKEQGIDVLHFPHVLSAIGVYHAIPGIGQLNLTSCLISKIFRQEIKSWKNHEILDQNPMLANLEASHITVVRHGTASAVTKAYTEVCCISMSRKL